MIIFLELEFLGLLNLLEAAGFLPFWLLGRTSEAPRATVLKVLPRLNCLRLRLCGAEMSVSVRQSGADSGGKARPTTCNWGG